MSEVWSLKGWKTEYKQVGPRDYEYQIKDPEGKVWNKSGKKWFSVHDISFENFLEEAEKTARMFVLAYASLKAETVTFAFEED